MSFKLQNRQRVDFNNLIYKEIPKLLKESTKFVKNDYKIEFFPLKSKISTSKVVLEKDIMYSQNRGLRCF